MSVIVVEYHICLSQTSRDSLGIIFLQTRLMNRNSLFLVNELRLQTEVSKVMFCSFSCNVILTSYSAICSLCIKVFGLICEFSLQVLHDVFPHHAFLMNGLIQGVKVCLTHTDG